MLAVTEKCTIFAAKFDNNTFIAIMFKRLHIRVLSLCMMLVIALAASAQRPQITDRLNQNGQVTVDAPKELVKRNNADLGKQQQTNSKDKKVKEKDKKKEKAEEEKLNELDEKTQRTRRGRQYHQEGRGEEKGRREEERGSDAQEAQAPAHLTTDNREPRRWVPHPSLYRQQSPHRQGCRTAARSRHRHEVPAVPLLHLL